MSALAIVQINLYPSVRCLAEASIVLQSGIVLSGFEIRRGHHRPFVLFPIGREIRRCPFEMSHALRSEITEGVLSAWRARLREVGPLERREAA